MIHFERDFPEQNLTISVAAGVNRMLSTTTDIIENRAEYSARQMSRFHGFHSSVVLSPKDCPTVHQCCY